ncbi:MAG: hypothetical protein WA002_15515 [Candidatus Acidiferrales bacterium]
MHGRTYYLTTLSAWRRHATQFAASHFVHAQSSAAIAAGAPSAERDPAILALVEADEGVHNSLEADPEWEALPHPLANKPVSDRVASALVSHGVTPGATTFDVADAVARAHPILRYRVF